VALVEPFMYRRVRDDGMAGYQNSEMAEYCDRGLLGYRGIQIAQW